MEKEVREVQSLLTSLNEAYEAQAAAMSDLQAQIRMIAESLGANRRGLPIQVEESAKRQNAVLVADVGGDDHLQQQELDRQVQQEVHPGSKLEAVS